MGAINLRKGRKSSHLDIYVLVVLCITFIWEALSALILRIDGAGRVQMLLLFSAFIVILPAIIKKYLKGPLVIYCTLAIYLFINCIAHNGQLNYEVDPYLQIFRKTITPPVFLLLCAYMFDKHQKTTVIYLFYSMLFYLVIYLFHLLSGTERIINENSAALVMIAAASLLGYGKIKGWFPMRVFLVSAAFLLGASVVIGSRMGLGVLLLLFVVFTFTYKKKISIKRIIIILISGLALGVFLLFVLKYTLVGERLMGTTQQTDTFSAAYTSGTILDKFGDRGLQYYLSWPYFCDSPFFGIGLGNWINFNPLGTVCHSEYLVQYLECGLVAFIPFVAFLYLLIHPLRKSIAKSAGRSRAAKLFVLYAMIGILFCNSVIWTNDQYAVFVIYALCYSCSKSRRKYSYKNLKSHA